ncbi:MAG TPA: DUF5684 domain-containing protein [Mucilaginibacter sp.]|jgi:hypothetical protein
MENYNSSPNVFAALGFIPIMIILVFAVIMIAAMWKVFTKAGKPGWACIIPIYNYIVICEIVGKPVWWFLLMICPCINIIFVIWVYNLLCKSFGKSEGFTVGLILLPFIFLPILGFGDARYLGPSAAEANAGNRFGSGDYQKPFDDNTTPQA